MVKVDEGVSSMCRQHCGEGPSQVQEGCGPGEYGDNAERKLRGIISSIGGQSALFLMAVGDCIVGRRSQAEVAMEYNIPGSGMQRAVSGRKEHQRGGKWYWQERGREPSEEDSTGGLGIRRDEGGLERMDDGSALDIGGQDSEGDRGGWPDVWLWGTSYSGFWSCSGPPHPPIGSVLEEANSIP